MFSIGAGELFLILIIAVIFLKPNDIPKYARLLGNWYKKLKDVYEEIEKTKNKVITSIDENIKESVISENKKNSEESKLNTENKENNFIEAEDILKDSIEYNTEESKNEERHLFYTTDFFPDNMKTLIIGSFPVPLYTQESLYYALDEESRLNAWYYGSKKNEFWKIIADVFEIENKDEFFKNKEEKINLFEKNLIGITDIVLICERKDIKSSEDKNLIIKKYNTKLIDTLKNYSGLKNIVFTSKFSEESFYKMLKNENFNFEIKNKKTPKIKTLDNTVLNSLKIKKLIVDRENMKNEITTVAISLKRSSVKGVSLYATKKTLFKYFLLK